MKSTIKEKKANCVQGWVKLKLKPPWEKKSAARCTICFYNSYYLNHQELFYSKQLFSRNIHRNNVMSRQCFCITMWGAGRTEGLLGAGSAMDRKNTVHKIFFCAMIKWLWNSIIRAPFPVVPLYEDCFIK